MKLARDRRGRCSDRRCSPAIRIASATSCHSPGHCRRRSNASNRRKRRGSASITPRKKRSRRSDGCSESMNPASRVIWTARGTIYGMRWKIFFATVSDRQTVPRFSPDRAIRKSLAAYHERSLLPEELNSWKEHFVGCANCQNILAQLEATDEISFEAAEREEVVEKGSEPVIAARSAEAFPAGAAPGQSQRAAGAAPPKKSRRALLLRGARWQWLAPAGAIAAGLLVWIALHENQPLALPSPKQVQVASQQGPPPPPPTPSVSTTVPEVSPSEKAALKKPQSAAGQFPSANTPGASGAVKSH